MTVTEIASLFHGFVGRVTAESCATPKTSVRCRRRGTGSRALRLTQPNAESVRRRIGIAHEPLDRHRRGEDLSMCNDQIVRRELILDNDFAVEVIGRPDGFSPQRQTVVEHKHRAHHLLKYVPLHERVQCHLYMYVLGVSDAELVETFGNQQVVHRVPFDVEFFESVRRVVQTHSSDFNEFLGDG